MSSENFDPVGIEREMVQAGILSPRADADTPNPKYTTVERHFTETDSRKYALWRISTVRQFQPEVLRHLSNDDLLYLSGQSPEGYSEAYGLQFDRNKVAQNALRARAEFDRRATQGAWFRSVGLALASLILGAVLTALVASVAN